MDDYRLLVLTEDADLIQTLLARLKRAGAVDPLVQHAATLNELTIRLAERDYQTCLVDLRSPTALRDASWLAGFAPVLAWAPTPLLPQQHTELEYIGVRAVLSPQIDGSELQRLLTAFAAPHARPDASLPHPEAALTHGNIPASEPSEGPTTPPADAEGSDESLRNGGRGSDGIGSTSSKVPNGRHFSRRALLRVITGAGALGLLSWLLVPQRQATLVSLATRPTRGPSPGATSAGPTMPVSAPTRPPGGPSPTGKPQPTDAPSPTDTPSPRATSQPTATPLPPGQVLLTYRGHSDDVLAVAWSPDGTRIASGSGDATMQVWDATTGVRTFWFQGKFISLSVAWSPDGQALAAAVDTSVQVWAMPAGQHLLSYVQAGPVYSVAWSPDSQRVPSAAAGTLEEFSPTPAPFLQSWPLPEASGATPADVLAWAPGSQIAAATTVGKILLYDPHTGQLTQGFSAQVRVSATSLAWSPDGKRLAWGGDVSEGVQVRPVAGGAKSAYLAGATVLSVAWSPDGKRLACGCADGTVVIVTA